MSAEKELKKQTNLAMGNFYIIQLRKTYYSSQSLSWKWNQNYRFASQIHILWKLHDTKYVDTWLLHPYSTAEHLT